MATKSLISSGVLYTDRRKFYLNPSRYSRLYPIVTPFISMLQAKGTRTGLDDPSFKMFEQRSGWRYQYMFANGADAWSGTTTGIPGETSTRAVDGAVGINVDSSLVGAELEIWNEAEDTYKGTALVTGVSGSDVTIVSVGNPTASNQAIGALEDNDKMYVIGTAFGENTGAPEAYHDELDVVWNECQVHKTALQISDELREAALRAESRELARLRDEKGKEHKIKQSRMLYFANRPTGIGGTAHGAGGGTDATFLGSTTDANSNLVRKTMGFIPIMKRYGRTTGDQQNVFYRSKGSYNYDQLVEDMDKMFQYFPNDGFLVAMVGNKIMNFFNKIGASGFVTAGGGKESINISSMGQSKLGFTFKDFETSAGVLRLVKEPLFRATPYANSMCVFNMDNVELVQYKGDEYTADILKDNNPRYQKDEYFSQAGLGLELVETHSYFELR